MQKSTDTDWGDLRFVLALLEAGTLSKAARRLGVDHTTVARRIAHAETQLGVALFIRSPRGYRPTADGRRLLPHLRSMDATLASAVRGIHGEDANSGVVHVTAPETFGACWVAPTLASLGLSHPQLSVTLDAIGAVADLTRGESDIALRFVRGTNPRLVVQRVASLPYGLYASTGFLAANPDAHHSLDGLPLLAPPPGDGSAESRFVRTLDTMETTLTSEVSVALLYAARAGNGIAVLPCFLGDGSDLERVPGPQSEADTLWLTVHEDARHTPRIRIVLDHLRENLKRL